MWNFCRWVADVPPRETSLSGEERGETSAVRRLHLSLRMSIRNSWRWLYCTSSNQLKRLIVIMHRCCLLSLYVLQNCDFVKKYPDSSLHVYYAGNLRYANCDNCCSRWYFTFNGAECSSPGTIDGAFYLATGRNHNPHLHRHIEGHCNNIQKGKVRVGFWVGKCVSGHKLADAQTGWHSLSRIFIEEVPKAQQ